MDIWFSLVGRCVGGPRAFRSRVLRVRQRVRESWRWVWIEWLFDGIGDVGCRCVCRGKDG